MNLCSKHKYGKIIISMRDTHQIIMCIAYSLICEICDIINVLILYKFIIPLDNSLVEESPIIKGLGTPKTIDAIWSGI